MTMPSSGVISFSDINTENRATAGSAVSLGGEASRIIARIPTGQISLSDLYGGSIPNLLDFQASASDTTSHSFSNLDIGPATANRRITLVFFGTQKPSGVTSGWTGTSVTLGSTAFPDVSWGWFQGGSGSTDFVAVAAHSASVGASEGNTANLTFTTNHSMVCAVAVFCANYTPTVLSHDSFLTSSGAATVLNETIDNQDDGYNLLFGVRKNTESLSFGGCTEKGTQVVNTDYLAFVTMDNLLAATTGRAVSVTGATSVMSVFGGISVTP